MGDDRGAGSIEETFGSAIPERIELTVGDTQRIPLPSAAGGGYSWEVSPLGGDPGAVVTRIEVGPVPSAGEIPTSAQAPETMAVTALHPGSAVVRLCLVRPWQRGDPLVDSVVQIVAE